MKRTKKFGVVAVALLLGLAGCGTTPKLEGADIPNAKEFLEKADAKLKEAARGAEADPRRSRRTANVSSRTRAMAR